MLNRLGALLSRLGTNGFTLFCIVLSIVLVVAGTLAQVDLGAFAAQKVFFNSWFVFKEAGGITIPVLPGGLTIAVLWLAGLSASFILRWGFFRRHVGLMLAHLGIVILLLGQAATQLSAKETVLPIEVGQTKNYTESRLEHELAIWNSGVGQDQVVSIPLSLMLERQQIATPALPFEIEVLKAARNARVGSAGGPNSGSPVRLVEVPVTYKDDETNFPAAQLQFKRGGEKLGEWIVSLQTETPQSVSVNGTQYAFALREKRQYLPFTLTLKKFTHDVYPGTQIPRNFASLVELKNPSRDEARDVLIYMNHPLRYQGLTFYQASYGKNDTLSVLQVVQNPVWIAPYLACSLVTLGLLLDLLIRFVLKKQPNGL